MNDAQTPLISIKNLQKYFPIHGGVLYRRIGNVHAVDGVSFDVRKGETIGLVGESGCGKSTLGKALLHLHPPTGGTVEFEGVDLDTIPTQRLRELRKEMQMIFQDPMESLNPRMSVGSILEEPFIIHKGEHAFDTAEKRKTEILRILHEVGLPASAYDKYPHEFSGGQRQRIGIARAIALKPKLVVCDEPVSALDVSVQSQVLNLMVRLQKEMELTYIFIAHNLSVVKYIADRICVMYLGRVVEDAESQAMYKKPMHPYTQALISAIPEPDPALKKVKQVLEGDVPSPIKPPPGCHFHPRCPYTRDRCKTDDPSLRAIDGNEKHRVACHFAEEILAQSAGANA
ncbi:ABC transporter ATP-binding protein [Pontiella sp.]|uniref:ABC transporter ATP-binding protein n=2 Tax=Pontiella sp. TaxID=2837462 RepID=UPI00356B5DB3